MPIKSLLKVKLYSHEHKHNYELLAHHNLQQSSWWLAETFNLNSNYYLKLYNLLLIYIISTFNLHFCATCHTANATVKLLITKFNEKLILRNGPVFGPVI